MAEPVSTYGETGLRDRSSVPHPSPTQTPPEIVERIERLRRNHKWSARRITLELTGQGVRISERTVGRWLERLADNGANYRAAFFTRSLTSRASHHQRTRPYTPRHNGKVERYQRILAEELLYARHWVSEEERARAIAVWNVHYNYHQPHTTADNRPPASRLRRSITNVMASNI